MEVGMVNKNMSLKSGPVSLYPENPHYFMFHGEPAILITSAEHYGAVINLDFNYVTYLDTLHKYELNYTRIYPGSILEIEGMFIEEIPLHLNVEALLFHGQEAVRTVTSAAGINLTLKNGMKTIS
jgi:hypothetical protein